MRSSGSGVVDAAAADDQWFYMDVTGSTGGTPQGPVSATQLQQMVGGSLNPSNLIVWKVGMPSWSALTALPDARLPTADSGNHMLTGSVLPPLRPAAEPVLSQERPITSISFEFTALEEQPFMRSTELFTTVTTFLAGFAAADLSGFFDSWEGDENTWLAAVWLAMMAFAGLRGAIAFALALTFPSTPDVNRSSSDTTRLAVGSRLTRHGQTTG